MLRQLRQYTCYYIDNSQYDGLSHIIMSFSFTPFLSSFSLLFVCLYVFGCDCVFVLPFLYIRL